MKHVAFAVILLGGFAISGLGQTDRSTRPRVASTAPPPVISNNPFSSSTPSSSPVLSGSTRPMATPIPPPSANADDDAGVIRVETNLVTMPVSVLDRDGRFISGLQQSDFKIFENGVEQKVDYFQSVEQPFKVVLRLDVSPSNQFRIVEIHN